MSLGRFSLISRREPIQYGSKWRGSELRRLSLLQRTMGGPVAPSSLNLPEARPMQRVSNQNIHTYLPLYFLAHGIELHRFASSHGSIPTFEFMPVDVKVRDDA